MLIRIIIGLFGLGLVVLVHELGHFLLAVLCGIKVDAFSIGWGPPFFAKTIRGVSFRLGIFPIGGYCKMHGEAAFKAALVDSTANLPGEPGSFYGASPIKRILVSLAGPLANLVFSLLVFSVIWGIGFDIVTLSNRIVLASEIESAGKYPADEAGLLSGDRIVSINGNPTNNYTDIQQSIAPFPGKNLQLVVDRDGKQYEFSVIPQLDTETGAGKLGVYFWTDPIIEQIEANSSAALADLQPGDIITHVNDQELPYTAALSIIMQDRPAVLSLRLIRNGQEISTRMVVMYDVNDNANLGIIFKTLRYRTPRLSIFSSIKKGFDEVIRTLHMSIYSISALFKGINLTKAISGPVRITYMVGDVAAAGFGESLLSGLNTIGNFLAFLSIALAFMNLLPIPALDGGLIVLFAVEAIRKKPLRTRTVYYYQLIGSALIIGLLLFSLFGDILFLIGQ